MSIIKDEKIELIKEKLILQLMELEEMIEITVDKKELKKLRTQYTKLNNKLKKEFE